VLSVKGVVHQYRRAPSNRHTNDLECENLSTADKPIYHGGGWLPATLHQNIRVLTPHIYVGEQSWANRPLSWDEILVCHDAPDCVVEGLRALSPSLGRDCFTLLVPGKCLSIGFCCLNGGGAFKTACTARMVDGIDQSCSRPADDFAPSIISKPKRQRTKSVSESENDDINQDIETKSSENDDINLEIETKSINLEIDRKSESEDSRDVSIEWEMPETIKSHDSKLEVETIEEPKNSLDSTPKPGTDTAPETGPDTYDQKKELEQ
jgi:hypothetical protein